MNIRQHHQRAIDRLADAYRHDNDYVGLIIGGSVAKGCARADSDVDFLIIARDDVYAERFARRDLFINRQDLCDYDGGYVDGKIINLQYLLDVAENGNEPSRASFEGAFVAFSETPDLQSLLQRIHVYPDDGHEQRLQAFYCMSFMQHWLMQEAQRHGNRYTLNRGASQLALFSGRLLLAHNRLLFPFHKWLPRALENAARKPAGYMQQFDQLLLEPTGGNASILFESLQNFHDWGISDLDAYTWFMTEVEWSWMADNTPMEDW